MPTLSNELRQQIDKAITCDVGCGHDTGFEACYEHQIDRLVKLFATQNTALLKELLGELPEEIDMMHAKKAHSDAGAGNVIGHNHLLSKVKNLINSKLAAMGGQ